MVGIYKIVSPTGKVYVGQAIDIEKRKKSYKKLKCKGQPRLYNSLVKYGFSEHIFEVVEQCSVEKLNTRERHWQDLYDVLSEKGLNCKLTKTGDKAGCYSQESRRKNSESLKAFWKTPEGQECRKIQVSNTDYTTRSEKIKAYFKTPEGVLKKEKMLNNLQSFWKSEEGRIITDQRTSDRNFKILAESNQIQLLQYKKEGEFIREWNSQKEAALTLKVHHTNISNCLAGRQKTAGGFIWKYKDILDLEY